MGLIYASIELISTEDILMARRHLIGEEEVKRIRVNMLVDTGSVEMCINENIRDFLQLPVTNKRRAELANGEILICDMVGPIDVRFENRQCIVEAIVLPGSSEPLLGAIPMEGMDVIIDQRRQEMIVHPDHPECAVLKLKITRLLNADADIDTGVDEIDADMLLIDDDWSAGK